MGQIKVITESGFACEVNEDAMDDMELFEALTGLMSEDKEVIAEEAVKLPAIITRFLGKEQKKALYEHCRNESGRVPTSAVMAEFKNIMNGLEGDKKKS